MDRETVIALAKKTDLWRMLETYSGEFGDGNVEADCLPELMAFAALVAAHEREACAKVLEAHPSYDFCRCPCECAAAIRSRT